MTKNERVAYHEAGHAIAGAVLGRPIISVTVFDPPKYGGVTEFGDKLTCTDPIFYARSETRDRIQRECICTEAGLKAEEIKFGSSQGVGTRDRQQSRDLALRALASDEELQTLFGDDRAAKIAIKKRLNSALDDYCRRAATEAERILRENWNAVTLLAAELSRRGTVTGSVVSSCLSYQHTKSGA